MKLKLTIDKGQIKQLGNRVQGLGINETQMQNVVDGIAEKASARVPVDTGNLRDSQYKSVTQQSGGLKGTVGYWGEQAPYNLIVHETWQSPGSANQKNTQAQQKFLESAAFEVWNDLHRYMK